MLDWVAPKTESKFPVESRLVVDAHADDSFVGIASLIRVLADWIEACFASVASSLLFALLT